MTTLPDMPGSLEMLKGCLCVLEREDAGSITGLIPVPAHGAHRVLEHLTVADADRADARGAEQIEIVDF